MAVPASLGAQSLMGGAFSLAWFSAVVPATFAGGGAAPLLFMLPFWLAGGLVAKQSVFDPARTTTLSIGEFAWDLQQKVAGALVRAEGGATEELDGASVEVAAYVNGVPTHVVRLAAGAEAWSVGDGLPLPELEWVAAEINEHLDVLRSE